MELDAEDAVARDDRDEAPPYSPRPRTSAVVGRAGRRTSARGRRPRSRRAPSVSGESRSNVTTFQPMCGSFSAAGVERASTSPGSRPRPAAPPARRSARTAAACRGRAPSTGAPAAARSRTQLVEPQRAQACASPPGTRRRRARQRRRRRGSASWSRVITRRARRRARAPSRRCGGCPCRSRRSRSRAHSRQRPLRRRARRSRVGSIATAARSARANALKHASIMWWAFVPASSVDVQRQPRAARRPRGRTPPPARGRSRR